jgi:hypothetical protein
VSYALAAGDVRRVQPHRREPIPPIGNAHVDKLAAPAGSHSLDVLLAASQTIRATIGTGGVEQVLGLAAPVSLRMRWPGDQPTCCRTEGPHLIIERSFDWRQGLRPTTGSFVGPRDTRPAPVLLHVCRRRMRCLRSGLDGHVGGEGQSGGGR